MFGLFNKKFDIDAFIAGSLEGLQIASEAHQSTWHLGEEKSWNVDQDEGRIVFTFADGIVATAPVQIVGTYNREDNSFLWAWDHPSVVPALQQCAAKVRDFAEEKGIGELSMRKTICSEQRAWEYSALAMRLSELNGAYRGEASPGTFVYMVFGQVSLVKTPEKN